MESGHNSRRLGEQDRLFSDSLQELPRGRIGEVKNVRLANILKSPKANGSAQADSKRYLKELGISLVENRRAIQFSPNYNERIHRWAPYVQGFSASFVQSIIDKYCKNYINPYILDPFAGCGTVLVQAKLNRLRSFGVELNPLLQFVAQTKLNSWDIYPKNLLKAYYCLDYGKVASPPEFLKSDHHFKKGVLNNLLKIKYAVDSYSPRNEEQTEIKNLLRLAFSSILIESSNLKRSPCLGYDKTKIVHDDAPMTLFDQKVHIIAEDLRSLQKDFKHCIFTKSEVACCNSMEFVFPKRYDLVITSPPYMNGLDYVINYKIEMAWLDFISSQKDAKKIKDQMVVCDNVSKGLIKFFSISKKRYVNHWIDEIKQNIKKNIQTRGAYRRMDMPEIVHKYFDDMYNIMENVYRAMNKGGRFVLVVGDSLIADVYVPTDIIIAKIGQDLGLKIEKVELARNRRSGQIRSYRLRESILTLKK